MQHIHKDDFVHVADRNEDGMVVLIDSIIKDNRSEDIVHVMLENGEIRHFPKSKLSAPLKYHKPMNEDDPKSDTTNPEPAPESTPDANTGGPDSGGSNDTPDDNQ